MGLGHVSVVEPASSNDFRDVILSQHESLRDISDGRRWTSRRRWRGRAPTSTRCGPHAPGGLFPLTLEEHLMFEEQAFPQALRDVIGWGGVLQAQIVRTRTRGSATPSRRRS